MDLQSRYELLEKIGSGSYATVYRARDLELGREVAIKQVHAQYLNDPDQLNRYWQEAQLLASLQHPNIVTIYDIYRERGWLILELMQANLAERLSGRQMDLKSLKTTLAHCLRALKYLHARGIVHGDIKPSNLMLDHRKRIKVGDFGLARRVSDEDGSLLKGTTKYMAPEVVSEEFGEVGPASDLYSLGFAAYELMCGSENFEQLFPGLSAFGRNKQVAWMMWHAAPDRRLPEIPRVLEGVPEDLARVVQKLVEKDQSKRYRSADEALDDLGVDQKIVRATGPSEGDETTAADPEQAGRRKRLMVAGGAFAASLLMCLVMLFGGNGGSAVATNTVAGNIAIVREVDAAHKALEVETLEEGKPRDLALDGNYDVYLTNIRKYVKLEDLQPGDRIQWERATDGGQPILKITATRPVVSAGRIRSIDRAAREIVVAVEGNTPLPLTLRLPDRAQVLVNAQIKSLDEAAEGDRVEVRYMAEPGDKPGYVIDRLEVFQPIEKFGFVSQIDPDKNVLTVSLGQGKFDQEITLPVAERSKVTLDGADLALAELRPGDAVRFEYDVEFRRIDASRPKTVQGPVQSIDYDRRELVVNSEQGPRTVVLGSSCEIQLDGGPQDATPTVGDLRRSDQVTATYHETRDDKPSITRLVVRRPAIHDRWALLIGVERTATDALPVIPHAGSDTKLVQETLRNRYAVPEDRIVTLLNQPREEMVRRIEDLMPKIGATAELVVYLCGHGYVGTDGGVYLAGPEFDPGRAAQTGVSLDWLLEALNGSPSQQKLLLLDLSHTRLEQQPSTQVMVNALKAPRSNVSIVASCREGQRGQDWQAERRGLFAHVLAAAYAGPADADRDLRITPQELFDFLDRAMTVTRAPSGESQNPVLFKPL